MQTVYIAIMELYLEEYEYFNLYLIIIVMIINTITISPDITSDIIVIIIMVCGERVVNSINNNNVFRIKPKNIMDV